MKNKNNNSWIIKITLFAFCASLVFSFLSDLVLSNTNIIVGIIILILFILIGVIFDMIGVSITSVDIIPFNAMSSKKVKGATLAVNLIKNADKVSSFCNDVIGDICGIISGAAATIISVSLANKLNIDAIYVTLFVTALTASLTIGGKAFGKSIAINNNVSIVKSFAKLLSIFTKKKK